MNLIYESNVHLGVDFGPHKVEYGFLGVYFEHLRGDFGHLGFAFESLGVGSWSLGVDFSASKCRLFVSGWSIFGIW